MRKIIFVFLFMMGCLNSGARTVENKHLQEFQQAFTALQRSPNDSNLQRRYFNAFPNNFPDLLVSLGYTNFSEPLPQYDAMLQAFGKLSAITEEEKMLRLSHLMVGGFWQADGIGETFRMMKDWMRKDADRALSVVSKLTNSQQILFWQCYWQNPCEDPSLEQDFKLFDATSGYNRERQVMKEAYEAFKGELPVL